MRSGCLYRPFMRALSRRSRRVSEWLIHGICWATPRLDRADGKALDPRHNSVTLTSGLATTQRWRQTLHHRGREGRSKAISQIFVAIAKARCCPRAYSQGGDAKQSIECHAVAPGEPLSATQKRRANSHGKRDR